MSTIVLCGRCRQPYDSDVQMPVCPHELIENLERERKARTETDIPPETLRAS